MEITVVGTVTTAITDSFCVLCQVVALQISEHRGLLALPVAGCALWAHGRRPPPLFLLPPPYPSGGRMHGLLWRVQVYFFEAPDGSQKNGGLGGQTVCPDPTHLCDHSELIFVIFTPHCLPANQEAGQ